MAISTGNKGQFFAIAAWATALTGAYMMSGEQRPAKAAQGQAWQCFNVSQVNGFHAVDPDTVRVTVGANTIYELKLLGSCPDIDWTENVGIRSTGGSSWVCQGNDAELFVPSPIGVQRCQVTSMRRLSPEEVQATRNRPRH
jgi:Family of unknown function (DUF6491)